MTAPQQVEDQLRRALERRADQLQIPHAQWRAPEQPQARRSRPRGRLKAITAQMPLLVSALVTVAIAAGALTALTDRHAPTPPKTNRSGANSATTLPKDNSTRMLNEWTACERSHGNSNQANPTVDHEVIYIATRVGALPGGDPTDDTAPCSEDLAAARRAVAGGQPIAGWGDDALYVKYANCMRADGYPTFPYPSGVEPDGHLSTNFNGTGIDPNSPAFLNGNANQTCGKQIGAPAWWINNWGPPGSVEEYPAGANPSSPLPMGQPRSMEPRPNRLKAIIVPGANGASGGNGPSAARMSSRPAASPAAAHRPLPAPRTKPNRNR